MRQKNLPAWFVKIGRAGFLFSVNIDILGAQLGIHNFLAAVKPIIAGKHETDTAGNGEQHQPLGAEQLDTQYYGSDGAVNDSTEQSNQPDCRSEAGSSPKMDPATQPKVEPIKKVGTISPPLNPAPMVTAVKRIFNAKASGRRCRRWPR